MSMKKRRLQMTVSFYVDDYLKALMEEMGFNKSELVEACILYVSMPGHEEDFKSQFSLVDEEEEEDDDEDDDEEEDDEEEDEEDGEGPSIGEVLGLGDDDEEEEEEG